jgi:hypothetical protein
VTFSQVLLMTRRLLLALTFVAAVAIAGDSFHARVAAADLPSRLSDQEFVKLITDSSEPNGYFRSDNLTSNELWFQHVIPDLVHRTRPGGVYLGVGPEQNYTYIAAVRPAMAIIFDIRRGNMLLQLMYKAIFELSNDRADFVSMLFSKPRPKGLGSNSSVDELFNAFSAIPTSDALYDQNLKAIDKRLTDTHHLPLSPEDLSGIRYVFYAFYWNGYAVRPSPTYAELMTEDDGAGNSRSYLASEESFMVLKKLETNNLLIPIVGDFGGPKAIRAVATYLKGHGATVSAFYLSNVEQYLYQDRKWGAFCKNVATLPLDQSSTFIRSSSGGGFGFRGPRFVSSLGPMQAETRNCGNF